MGTSEAKRKSVQSQRTQIDAISACVFNIAVAPYCTSKRSGGYYRSSKVLSSKHNEHGTGQRSFTRTRGKSSCDVRLLTYLYPRVNWSIGFAAECAAAVTKRMPTELTTMSMAWTTTGKNINVMAEDSSACSSRDHRINASDEFGARFWAKGVDRSAPARAWKDALTAKSMTWRRYRSNYIWVLVHQ